MARASIKKQNYGRSGAAVHKGRMCKLSQAALLAAANLGNGLGPGKQVALERVDGFDDCAKGPLISPGVVEIRIRCN